MQIKFLKLNVILGAFLVVVALYTNRNHIGVNAWLDWNVMSFVGDGETSNSFDEYAPLGYVKVADKDKPKLIEGQAENIVRTTDKITFTANAGQDSVYKVNILYFPDISVSVDGSQINFPANQGILKISIPAGRHQVEIKFEKTIIEKISLIFSAISVIILSIFLIRKSKAR